MSRDEINEHCLRLAEQARRYQGPSLADPTTKLWTDADQAKLDAAIAKHYRQMLQDSSMRSYRDAEERRK
jgi:hypothetical protein